MPLGLIAYCISRMVLLEFGQRYEGNAIEANSTELFFCLVHILFFQLYNLPVQCVYVEYNENAAAKSLEIVSK